MGAAKAGLLAQQCRGEWLVERRFMKDPRGARKPMVAAAGLVQRLSSSTITR